MSYNEIGLGIPLLASALRYNRKLTYLNEEGMPSYITRPPITGMQFSTQ